MIFIIEVNDVPPSNNQFLGQASTNWKYNRIKKHWDSLISEAITGRPDKPLPKAKVHIHYIFPDRRRRDPDNYSGKMIMDPLVTHGFIIDDSFNNVKLTLSAEVKPKEKWTIITITGEKIEEELKSGRVNS